MIRPASATKLPGAGFRRRRKRRSDPSSQTMMTGTAVSAVLAVGSRRSRIPLGERATDVKQQYHHRAAGPVVSKCALRDKRKQSAPVSRNAPLALLKCLSQKQVQFIHRHVNGSRTVFLNQRAFLDQPACSGFSFFLPIPHLCFLQPVLCLEQFLLLFCHDRKTLEIGPLSKESEKRRKMNLSKKFSEI